MKKTDNKYFRDLVMYGVMISLMIILLICCD